MRKNESNRIVRTSHTLESAPDSAKQSSLSAVLQGHTANWNNYPGSVIQGQFTGGQVVQRVEVKGMNSKEVKENLKSLAKVLKLKGDQEKKFVDYYLSIVEEYNTLDECLVAVAYDYMNRNNQAQKDWTTKEAWLARALEMRNITRGGHVVVRLYRTMNLSEYEQIIKNKGLEGIKGHVGDFKEALSYLYRSSLYGDNKFKCLISFEFSVDKTIDLFSEILFPSPSLFLNKKMPDSINNMCWALQNEKRPIYYGASIDQGYKNGKMGYKSEDTGDGKFSIGIGDAAHASRRFLSYVSRFELLAINFLDYIYWIKNMNGTTIFNVSVDNLKAFSKDLDAVPAYKNNDLTSFQKLDVIMNKYLPKGLKEGVPTVAGEEVKDGEFKNRFRAIDRTNLYMDFLCEYMLSHTAVKNAGAIKDKIDKYLDAKLIKGTTSHHQQIKDNELRPTPEISEYSIDETWKWAVFFDISSWETIDYGAGGDSLFCSLLKSKEKDEVGSLRLQITEKLKKTDQFKYETNVDKYITGLLSYSPYSDLQDLSGKCAKCRGIEKSYYYDLMALPGICGGNFEILAYKNLYSNMKVLVIDINKTCYRIDNNRIEYFSFESLKSPEEAMISINKTCSNLNAIVLYKTPTHYQRIIGVNPDILKQLASKP